MTLCIAAQCAGRADEPLFLLCTDSRLDAGASGCDDAAYKAHCLGYNYLALMAGDWNPVRRLCGTIQQDLMGQGLPQDALTVADRVADSVDRFCASSRCKDNTQCQLIVTGFAGKLQEPMMLFVLIDGKQSSVEEAHDYYAIGEGADAAIMLLRHRGYDPLNTRIEKACYLMYEAKRFSETVSSVGLRHRLKIHAPIARRDPVATDLNDHDITIEGLAKLEEMRLGYFLQSVPKHLDPFPHSYFTDAKGLLGPEWSKVGPSPQPPSQE